MSKNIQLLLPKPCHEQWDAMTPTQKGRFCDSCSKEVIDFMLMTDQQILNHISRSGKNICGRLAPDQLNRDLIRGRERRPNWLGYVIQFALPALLMTSRLSAQSTHKPHAITTSYQHLKKKIGKVAVGNSRLEPIETKLALPDIDVHTRPALNLESETNTFAVIVGGITICRRTTPVLSKIKDSLTTIFKTDSIKLYPNPVARGESITIDFDLKNSGAQLIEVFNVSGQKLAQKNVESNSKKFSDQLNSNFAFVPGLYLVRVTNMSSKKQVTRKLVVQ